MKTNRKLPNPLVLAIVFFIVLFGLFAWAYERTDLFVDLKSDKVAVTVFPLYDIVRQVAGDTVSVELLLPSGASPHTFEPRPSDLKKIANSKTLFRIGHGLDDWAENMARSAEVKNIVIVDSNISLHESDHDHFHDDDGTADRAEVEADEAYDPHYWLTIPNAMQIAQNVAIELKALFPEKSSIIDANLQQYLRELETLDLEIRTQLSELPTREIATFHNAWGYFAEFYGLEIVATFEEFPGETPSPAYLSHFQEELREHAVSVVFAEPQFSTAALEPIAGDLGVEISQLDPLGGIPERNSYLQLMRYNVNQIVTVLTQ